MRHSFTVPMCVVVLTALAGCDKSPTAEEVDRAFQDVNALDGTGISEIMLTAGDPNEAVAYFNRSLNAQPDRIDFARGLAVSLVRANRIPEAKTAWTKVISHPDSTLEDQVNLADAHIRANEWDQAEQVLNAIPPTHETFKRYRLEAMMADSKQDWAKADSFYEIAVGLTTTPAGVLNNWGYSKLSRGDYAKAEQLFGETLRYDRTLYTAKNNMVLARAAQGNYTLPPVPMTQVERAQLLHSLALTAIKRGDVEIGKALLRDAVDTHPQHFEEAARALSALDAKISN